MDFRVEVGEKEAGTIPYESLPAFTYLFRELGFDVLPDTENQKVQLCSALHGKKIVISSDYDVKFNTYRKGHLEKKVLEYIKTFLSACGAKVILKDGKKESENADFHVYFSLFEIPVIKEPILELIHNSKSTNKKLLDIFHYECTRTGTKFKSNEVVSGAKKPFINIQIMYPVITDEDFWEKLGEKYAMSITIGILARFHESSPLSVLSLVPIEIFSNMFVHSENTGVNLEPTMQKEKRLPEKKKFLVKKPTFPKRKEAEVFLDYHIFIEEHEDRNKIKLIGNLHIKNIGTEVLRNPVICLRSTPSESIKISGQILPPNVAETLGVMKNEETKGWKYMNDEWFEEMEKGETWICPIQSKNINPRQTESLTNLQISVLQPEENSNIRVEAFVFFKEQDLEISSSNQISLLLSKKQ
ncbi:hypothetical protein [Peribacillus simplex]|uniref:Uncharacterized protein n=1 Tax=Peribacillus simplex NBRC 15720 = DSM 1321 TaxID=1349754 RepID=A0A223ENL1_9BACI|nr:hypothetical protein [Peribacillus simplex]ASS96801.1 hypothetical protein BS1321_24575 [Peribacillus simplex NBRC 15720 = DSM 1321]MEC1395781.1 hypothetical protein [Peribacillus simplex]